MLNEIIVLIEDQIFMEWVLHPNDYLAQYWEKITQENPDKSESIRYARSIVQAIYCEYGSCFPKTERITATVRNVFPAYLKGNRLGVSETKFKGKRTGISVQLVYN